MQLNIDAYIGKYFSKVWVWKYVVPFILARQDSSYHYLWGGSR